MLQRFSCISFLFKPSWFNKSCRGKMLKLLFNNILTLTMKSIGCVVHKFPTNLYKHKHSPNKCKTFYLLSKIYIYTTTSVKIPLLSGFAQPFTYHQDFLCAPYCYKKLSNHFHKPITSIEVN